MAYGPLDLTGKVAVVTGGTSGIGRALTRGLAEAGADVVPTSRRARAGRGRRGRGGGAGPPDAARDQRRDRPALARRRRSAPSCGRSEGGRARQLRRTHQAPAHPGGGEADWNAIVDTNLTGTLRACRVFGRHMLERGSGRIINIASLATFVALFEVAAYSASKAAVASLTKSLAVEWGPRGVNVNAIAPGVFPTDLNRKLIEGTPARPRAPDAHAAAALRHGGGAGGGRGLPGLGRRQLRERRGARGGRRIPGQRSEPMSAARGCPASAAGPATRVGHYRWMICALLFFGTTINYIDRQVIGILKPTLVQEFGWQDERIYAAIVFTFQLAYAHRAAAGRPRDGHARHAARIRHRGRACGASPRWATRWPRTCPG